jgi:hypothetical protein
MSKIGDLIVRLKLQYKDYEKGLKDAEKRTKGFSSNLGKAFSAAKLGIAAIASAAVFLGKQLIESSNKIGDAWNATVAGMKGAWQSALSDMASYKPDFSSFRNFFKGEWEWIKNLFGNAKVAGEAASAMSRAFDAEFELENSLKIQRARIRGLLADLQVDLMNTNLSPEARLAAAEKYRALLEPLYEAEIRVRKNMLDAAVKAWLAGSGVDASVAEVVDFFSHYGTNAPGMTAKYPELANIYETRKGDQANKVIFDAITKLEEAESGLADELKRVNKSVNTITGLLEETSQISFGLEKLNDITSNAVAIKPLPDIIPDDWLTRNREKIDEALAEAMRLEGITNEINRSFENAIVDSLSGATQALTDCIAGIEGADASRVLSALLEPFASTMIQMGEMLILEGLGIDAFKEALASLDGVKAMAAGAALLAMGAALSSGIRALGGANTSMASTSGASSSYSGSSSIDTYQQEITVRVVGELAGDKIILAGERTLNKWNR